MMVDTGQPPPGGGQHSQPHPAMTPDMSRGGTTLPRRMRSFEEIMNEAKQNRNILVVTVTKIVKFENGKEERPANLSMEDVGTLLFDIIKLDVKDALGVSLTTNRYDTKEINLKPDVDRSKYITKAPIEFKGHSITVTQQRVGVTKVTFKNVPWNIPDEELINLCQVYGEPINNLVTYEQMPRA